MTLQLLLAQTYLIVQGPQIPLQHLVAIQQPQAVLDQLTSVELVEETYPVVLLQLLVVLAELQQLAVLAAAAALELVEMVLLMQAELLVIPAVRDFYTKEIFTVVAVVVAVAVTIKAQHEQ
jgi:hypothetical protein